MTTTDEARAHFAGKLVVARNRAAQLDDGPVRAALSDEFFAGIEERLAGDLSGWSTWPPAFIYAADHCGEHLADLDAVLQTVIERTSVEKRPEIGRWLLAEDGDAGPGCGAAGSSSWP